jgi:antirestriction protein ArdC
MDRREIAAAVLDALYEGIVPWRFPANVLPELKPVFGPFVTGDPGSEAEADYGELDAILAATGAKVVTHWRVAKPRCDRPPRDRILLPPRSRFFSERTYHASRIHEVLHFLEQPERAGWIGRDDQSEMVCEVGTSFLESHLRLPPDQDITNIKKWLPAWTDGIKADPNYLFDAVAQAEKAVRYLLGLRRKKDAA